MKPKEKQELESAGSKLQPGNDSLPTIRTKGSRAESASNAAISRIPIVTDDAPKAASRLSAAQLKDRAVRNKNDRVVLSRIFAAFVGAVAVLNLIPGAVRWMEWLGQTDETPLPIWVSIVVFVSGWQMLYSVMLMQVPDWSTLKATAIAMLAIIVFYGISATMLTLMNGNHWLGRMVQLSDAASGRAAMWCFAMMCLAVIVSLAAARESSRWRRIEELTVELLAEETRLVD